MLQSCETWCLTWNEERGLEVLRTGDKGSNRGLEITS